MTDKAMAPASTKPMGATEGNGKSRLVVIDIGKKQSKKAIKRLREGRGKLLPKIESAIKEVQQEAGESGSPIVVVIERKRSSSRWLW